MKLHELEQARKAQAQSDKHVYFDESGNIVYYGRTESDEYVDSNHAVLSYDQCMIIEDSSNKTTNDFIIIVDPTTEGVYTLVNKQIELEKTEEDWLKMSTNLEKSRQNRKSLRFCQDYGNMATPTHSCCLNS